MHTTKAKIRWTGNQFLFYLLLTALIATGFIISPFQAFIWFVYATLIIYFIVSTHKIIAIICGIIFHDLEGISTDEINMLEDDKLPKYTILVPLYHEANIVSSTVEALSKIDYPSTKLDIKLLLEEDDIETLNILKTVDLPSHFNIVTVPDGLPKTKPRACNYGMKTAAGEFLVIYDAEDRPEPDQLKKAVIVFNRAGQSVGCLQAKLNFYNSNDNFLSRWFTFEYSAWFDLFLPGLHAIRCPIPLGGTSNHFRIEVLRDIGGWDPYNVTEDCDLGIELARNKSETRILDSTTWEECPNTVWTWLKQRSRWMKGYWQTFLVHSRSPTTTCRHIGINKFLQMLILVGGHIAVMLLNPFSWCLMIAWLIVRWQIFYPESPWTLVNVIVTVFLFGLNFLFILVHFIAGLKCRISNKMITACSMPLYWVMISIGAIRGFLHFFYAPFKWEKTIHGHSKQQVEATDKIQEVSVSKSGVDPLSIPDIPTGQKIKYGKPFLIVLISALVILFGTALYLPVFLQFPEKIRQAAIRHDDPYIEQLKNIDKSWFNNSNLKIKCKLSSSSSPNTGQYRLIIILKVDDGEWYQLLTDTYQIENNILSVNVSLGKNWQPVGSGRPWGPWSLRRIREAGIRIFPEHGFPLSKIELMEIKTDGKVLMKPLTVTSINVPAKTARFQLIETDFTLSREYLNPFDPHEIDIQGEITLPDGNKECVAAYYTQDYQRKLAGEKEILTPCGTPHWRLRYTPAKTGLYHLRLIGKDSDNNRIKTENYPIQVSSSNAQGFVKVDTHYRFFSYSNGNFCYPVCLNIRSPADTTQPFNRDFKVPPDSMGTYAYDSFFRQMRTNGITMGRIWMSPWFSSIEWHKNVPGFHGVGYYNLQNAWRLDYLLEKASHEQLLLELVLHHHGPFTMRYDSQWHENPYNIVNGGKLSRTEQVLNHPWAIQMVKNRFRYISARYGAFPSLFAWVLWIEVNVICHNNRSLMAEWHRQMAPYLKKVDLDRHPISTEFNNTTGFPSIWKIPDISYTQLAAYDYGWRGLVNIFRDRYRAVLKFDKPIILEEYGGQPNGGSMKVLAQGIHDGLWAGWMMPFGATPMAWWWNLIFSKNLTRFYAVFVDYIAGEDLRKEKWKYLDLNINGNSNIKAVARAGKQRGFLWIYNNRISNLFYRRGHYRTGPQRADTYFQKMINPDFNPVTDSNPVIFPTLNNLSVTINNLPKGTYTVEFWNTWKQQPPQSVCIKNNNGSLIIPLPPLCQDIAVKYMLQPTTEKGD